MAEFGLLGDGRSFYGMVCYVKVWYTIGMEWCLFSLSQCYSCGAIHMCGAKHVVYMSWCKLHSSVERPADSLAKVGDCREPPPLTSRLTSASAFLFLSETLERWCWSLFPDVTLGCFQWCQSTNWGYLLIHLRWRLHENACFTSVTLIVN